MPPTMKNTIAVTPYMIPSFLWSTVNSHARQPVEETGRLNTPRVLDGVTVGRAGPVVVAGMGRSMMAIARCGLRWRWRARSAEPGDRR